MHCVRKVYFRWKKEREREELLALVQCRFEIFSGQYLISTNKTNKITAKSLRVSVPRERYNFFDSNTRDFTRKIKGSVEKFFNFTKLKIFKFR